MSWTADLRVKNGEFASFEDLQLLAENADYLQDALNRPVGRLNSDLTDPVSTVASGTTIEIPFVSGTTGFWAVGNPTRILVPSGYSWVKISANVRIGNIASSYVSCDRSVIHLRKNGTTTVRFAKFSNRNTSFLKLETPWLQVTGGTDYFEIQLAASSTNSREYSCGVNVVVAKI